MIYLTAQPDRIKFYWQLRVQLENFRERGISMEDVHVLIGCDGARVSPEMQSLRKSGAKIFFYPYRRDYRYISSVRPHLLAQHYELFPELCQQYVFYLDSDVIFRTLPDYARLTLDGRWYVSDTRSYLDSRYIISAGGPTVFKEMCDTVGIHPFHVKERDHTAGGAQYLLHGVHPAFWRKVEADSILLFTRFSGNPGLQIWCADMWALLWNAWMHGKHTEITEEMSFSWATSSQEVYRKHVMLHMAGVHSLLQYSDPSAPWYDPVGPHFDKGRYDQRLPFGEDFSFVSPRSASLNYVKYINRIASCIS